MALKSVVTDKFFDRVMAALKELEQERGLIDFALLSNSHLDRSRWDMNIAAAWSDNVSRLRTIREVSDFIDKQLGDSRRKLAGVLVRSTDDHFVQAFTSSVDIPSLGTAYHVTGVDIERLEGDDVVCLVSRPSNMGVGAPLLKRA